MRQMFDQRQHYVPEAYLKGFTEERKGFFHELRKQDLRIRRQHINNVCYSTNFYDITDEPILKQFSIKPRYLEHCFTYERILPSLLKAIHDHAMYITRQEFEVIVEAYVSIKHRTPFYRKKVDELQKEGKAFDDAATSLKRDIEWLLNLQPAFNYDQYVEKLKHQFLQDPDFAKKSHQRSLVESSFDINDPVRSAIIKILSMNIAVIETRRHNDYFFVSDNPGYSVLWNKPLNTNFGEFDMIHFPINSQQVLLLHGFDALNYLRPLIRFRYIPINSSLVNQINRSTYGLAHGAVFCEDRKYIEIFKSALKESVSEFQSIDIP